MTRCLLVFFQKLKDGFSVYKNFLGFNSLKSLFYLIILSINYLKKIELYAYFYFYNYTNINLVFAFYFCKKNNFLLNLSGNKHQEFATEKKIPLIGGVIIISMILFSSFRNFNIFLIFLFAIFLVGLLSDLKKI